MAAYTSTQDGNWNDPATWGGSGYPSASGDTATINHTVTYNVNSSSVALGTVTVGSTGVLVFPTNQTTYMRIAGNLYNNGGIIRTGSSSATVTDRIGSAYTCTIQIDCTSNGQYGLEEASYSEWYLNGASMTYYYTTAASAISAGATSITTSDTTGWSAGDLLYIYGTSAHDQGEIVEISSISGTSITLTSGTTYAHASGVPILHLSRNLIIKSGSSTYFSYGKLVQSSSHHVFRGVLFQDMGAGGNWQEKGIVVKSDSSHLFVFDQCVFYQTPTASSSNLGQYALEIHSSSAYSGYGNPINYKSKSDTTPQINQCVWATRRQCITETYTFNSLYIKDCFFGMHNKTSAYNIGTSMFDNAYFEGCTFGNCGRMLDNGGLFTVFDSCNFETYNGVSIPSNQTTGDWYQDGETVLFYNCNWNSKPTVTSFAQNWGYNAPFNKIIFYDSSPFMIQNAIGVEKDTTTYYGTSGSSWKLSGDDSNRYHWIDFDIPVDTTGTATVSFYYKMNTSTWTYSPVVKLINPSGTESSTTLTGTTTWTSGSVSVSCSAGDTLTLRVYLRTSVNQLWLDSFSVSVA